MSEYSSPVVKRNCFSKGLPDLRASLTIGKIEWSSSERLIWTS